MERIMTTPLNKESLTKAILACAIYPQAVQDGINGSFDPSIDLTNSGMATPRALSEDLKNRIMDAARQEVVHALTTEFTTKELHRLLDSFDLPADVRVLNRTVRVSQVVMLPISNAILSIIQ
jgi:glutamate racemase